MNVTVQVSDTRVAIHLEQFPAALKAQLQRKITTLTNTLLGRVKALEPHRTGRLQSLTRSYVDVRQNFVRGRVRVLRSQAHNTAAAAGALEYGAPGKRGRFSVRGYKRRSGTVRSYDRTARIREMRFLRGPAAAMLPQARAEIEAAVNEAVQEFNK
jgi:hypothetical protein